MNYADYGFIRIAACSPVVAIADPLANARAIIKAISDNPNASLLLFPELCVSGYTCEDLFFSRDLLVNTEIAMGQIAAASPDQVVVVGCPWQLADGRLLNVAMVCHGGRVVGAVPKVAHPNYGEFYDKRWFASGQGIDEVVSHALLGEFYLGCDQLFSLGESSFAIEICEDLWLPTPPFARHVVAGAELILNLSASNELVAKADYRRDLVRMASAQGVCAYLYASAGPTESTKDIVFGGHLIFAENGVLAAESDRFSFSGSQLQVEYDWQKLRHDRIANSTFACSPRPGGYRKVALRTPPAPIDTLIRQDPPQPFVPDDEAEFGARAIEIMKIQSTGLARRVMASRSRSLVLGLSGGLDSTLAMLVCLDTLKLLDYQPEALVLITMPGPATSEHTLLTARMLAEAGGTGLLDISIEKAVTQHLSDLRHTGEYDVVFENAQARERTQLLFDYANKCGGIVVGTGDLSELALGWCTYNADHMSSYGVNSSVPKTMVQYLIRWYARHRASDAMQQALERVLDTPISPELVPSDDGEVAQQTESIVGPYELHDFFIYHYLRNGFGVEKLFALAAVTHGDNYSASEIKKWLRVFIQRFHTQQFKRTTLPAGPKIGSVSLSPRGDWRMPDEASFGSLIATIDAIDTESVS